ncbi:MAG: 3-hydroxyacyl-CoA dehydrogenase family protein [Desulfobacteraceae bacterium]
MVCNDYPGFGINAMLFPCIPRAFDLLESGVGTLEIDEAMTRFALPAGPGKHLLENGGLRLRKGALKT